MKKVTLILSILFTLSLVSPIQANSYVAADLTYSCLGGNTYLISLSYYRDCSGDAEPASRLVHFSCSSDSTLNFSASLFPIWGTGYEITPGCGCDYTTCQGGTHFGVQEYIYQAQVTMIACNQWKMWTSGCCRNTVGTVANGSANGFYIETTLDNLSAPCNSSPFYSNKPIAIVCNNYSFCFNHGAIDYDGDSLVYSFTNPKTNPYTSVPYQTPYSSSNFLNTIIPPGITIDALTGDICFTPNQVMSSITSVKVEEWRTINGSPTLIGTNQRDIQFHVRPCPNEIPVLSGIDTSNTHTYNVNDTTYSMQWDIGQTIDFDINGYDADTAKPGCNVHPENFSILWNNGIPSATFTTHFNGTDSAYAHFHWQPTFADVATSPHCFTATIQDEACPYMGYQSFDYCLTITSGVGIENKNTQAELNIYPNPSDGMFMIDFITKSDAICYVKIVNVEGKEIFQQEWQQASMNSKHGLDLSEFSAGVYVLHIKQGNYSVKSKLIVQK